MYLAQNKLRCLEGLEGLTRLRKLDVGGNRIRSLGPVKGCVGLEELWAGKNKVRNKVIKKQRVDDGHKGLQ